MKSVSDRSAARNVFHRVLMGGAACIVALALASCSDGGAAPKAASAPAVKPADYAGTVAHVRRISVDQYRNTVTYIFGHDIEVGNPFAPLRRTDGLIATGASSAGVTSGELQQLQRSASSIAAQVIDKGNIEQKTPSRRDFLVPCKPADTSAADDACATKFIAQTSRLLYRRPLPEARVTELVATAHKGATDLKDFYAGLGTVLEGMLIDPKVLLIADVVEPDPAHPGKQRLDAYSLASRLSFFLWNAAPDDAVLKAAERGDLFDAKKRAKVVDMMIASPRIEDGVRAFFDDMFGFEDFGNLAKDPTIYPMMTGAVIKDAREQTLRTVVNHLVVEKQDYRDLFTTHSSFISEYNFPVASVTASAFSYPFEVKCSRSRSTSDSSTPSYPRLQPPFIWTTDVSVPSGSGNSDGKSAGSSAAEPTLTELSSPSMVTPPPSSSMSSVSVATEPASSGRSAPTSADSAG
ncbi:MAG: DUF1592 domain-containing protein, partial [Proteobacteria bacterium]|nr:DUF1592 domain-containing protein [Pseudomonadota bacterium]